VAATSKPADRVTAAAKPIRAKLRISCHLPRTS